MRFYYGIVKKGFQEFYRNRLHLVSKTQLLNRNQKNFLSSKKTQVINLAYKAIHNNIVLRSFQQISPFDSKKIYFNFRLTKSAIGCIMQV